MRRHTSLREEQCQMFIHLKMLWVMACLLITSKCSISLNIFKGHLLNSMLPDLCTNFSISYADKREKSACRDVMKKVEGDAADICQRNTPECHVGKIVTKLGYFKNP